MAIGTCCRLVMIKSFSYRGLAEEFSNGWCFQGLPPGDAPSWNVLANDVVNHEKGIFPPAVSFVRAYGYDNNDPKKAHVFTHDFTLPGPPPVGTFAGATGHPMAGDQAGLVWWLLERKTEKGKPSYLRKYFHGGFVSSTAADELDNNWLTALNNFASPTGIQSVHGGLMSPGGPKDSDPDPGSTVKQHSTSLYVTTRTLRRRGKRPKAA